MALPEFEPEIDIIMENDSSFMCRACLNLSDISTNLFNLKYEESTLSEMFEVCTSIQVAETPNLPKHICKSCINDLITTYSFIKKCQSNDLKLKTEYLNHANNQQIIVVNPTIKLKLLEAHNRNDENHEVITLDLINEPIPINNDIGLTNNVIAIKEQHIDSTELPYNCDSDKESCLEQSLLDTHQIDAETSVPGNCPEGGEFIKNMEPHQNLSQPTTKYTCEICRKQLTSKESLRNHLYVHNKSINCEICDKAFSIQSKLNEHMNTHTGERPFICNICDKGFKQKNTLRVHMLFHGNIRNYNCDVCGKAFRQKVHLSYHMRVHTKDCPYHCKTCGRSFRWRLSFKLHRCNRKKIAAKGGEINNEKEGDKVQEIDKMQLIAEEDVKVQSVTENNEKIVDKSRPYTCTVCHKSFKQLAHCITHQRTHTGAQPYKCNVCNKCFTYLTSTKLHLKKAHGIKYQKGLNLIEKSDEERLSYERPADRIGVVKCEICSTDIHKSSLKHHIMTHTGEKPHMCEICGKTFIQKHLLTEHNLKHTGETPFICEHCGRGFGHFSTYKEHLTIHIPSEDPVPCQFCNKVLRSQQAWRRHQLTHNKRYLCSQCGKVYPNKTQLTEHSNVHLGIKPHQCNVCKKAFSKKRDFKFHVLTHQGVKPFVCRICDKSYVRRCKLNYHSKKVHGVDLTKTVEWSEELSQQQVQEK